MAINAPREWLICYDVREPKRLVRLHRFLRRRAVPIQYSVFCFSGTAAHLGGLVPDIEAIIDVADDDVRIYQLPERPQCDVLGRGSVPHGTTILSDVTPGISALILGTPG